MKRLPLLLVSGLLLNHTSLIEPKDLELPMIDITSLAPRIRVDMRYATPNNFTGKILYPQQSPCLLCEPAAKRLAQVQKNLEKKGLGLKVWDCYRPHSVQKKLWEVVPDARYVANPAIGSKHNRGASVDCTLVDEHGQELIMPTPFDEFSEKAHRDNMNLPAEAISNRRLLEEAMGKEGFIGIPKEWWHFDDPEWSRFALRDEPLGDPVLYQDAPNQALRFRIPSESRQIVVVIVAEWRSTKGELRLFEKEASTWTFNSSWKINVGTHGLRWGLGLHENEALVRIKEEGDLSTPAGVFDIGPSYGLEDIHPGSGWPHHIIDATFRCIDDPRSNYYNQILSTRNVPKPDWNSAEHMVRPDELYRYVVNINHNTHPVKPGAGSCIFFHVWRGDNTPTEGCISMQERDIKTLINWLKPAARPLVVILPEAVYATLKEAWALP